MIFKVEAKNLSVYDPKSDSFIAQFTDGQFETQDIIVSERLIELGYKPDEKETEQEVQVDKPKRGRPKVIK